MKYYRLAKISVDIDNVSYKKFGLERLSLDPIKSSLEARCRLVLSILGDSNINFVIGSTRRNHSGIGTNRNIRYTTEIHIIIDDRQAAIEKICGNLDVNVDSDAWHYLHSIDLQISRSYYGNKLRPPGLGFGAVSTICDIIGNNAVVSGTTVYSLPIVASDTFLKRFRERIISNEKT